VREKIEEFIKIKCDELAVAMQVNYLSDKKGFTAFPLLN